MSSNVRIIIGADKSEFLRNVEEFKRILRKETGKEVEDLDEQIDRTTKDFRLDIEKLSKKSRKVNKEVRAKDFKTFHAFSMAMFMRGAESTSERILRETKEKIRRFADLSVLEIAGLISGATGFLSLFTALSRSQEERQLSLALAFASNLVSIATSYGTIAAASGNIALFAAAGTAAASAATIINTITSIGVRGEANRQAEERRLQNLRQY